MAAKTVIGTATYKGRVYNVLFMGATKFGERAHLQFSDGSKDFWVDAAGVSGFAKGGAARLGRAPGCGKSRTEKADTGSCWECGGPMPQWKADRGDICDNC